MSTHKDVALPPRSSIRKIVRTALEEDLGFGDVTSNTLIPANASVNAQIMAKEAMVVTGLEVAQEVFHQVDDSLIFHTHQQDGAWVKAQTKILTVTGKAQSLLQAERVALNFMQRLSGISTLTRQFCQAARRYPVKIADTRKTTPGLRVLEKWAVRVAGGFNHRISLHDGILIKDNHLMVLRADGISLSQACRLAKQQAPHGLRISVEVESLTQVREALKGNADIILLDNMNPSKIRQAVKIIKNKALIEVSGGITLNNIQEFLGTGIDIISIGALTHSAPAMDVSMDITRTETRKKRRNKLATLSCSANTLS